MPEGSGTIISPGIQQSIKHREHKKKESYFLSLHRKTQTKVRKMIKNPTIFKWKMDLSTHQDCKLHSVTANYIHETLLYYLKEMLMRQIVSWIKFKDEDMIYSSLSPTVRVDAQ